MSFDANPMDDQPIDREEYERWEKEKEHTAKVVHLAGNAVCLDGRIIQRCLICGEKLADNLNCAMPVEPDGSDPVFPTWGTGAWVEIDGNHSGLVGESESPEMWGEQVPENCCVSLVEQ